MSAAALTLISHHLCPYVQRAAIVLTEKQVAFERLYVDLADKPGWFKVLSPLGKVPLLRIEADDGAPSAVLFESAPICEYLDETLGTERLHPSDPLQRARHRAWMEFGSAVLADIWRLETAAEAETFEAARAALGEKFARLEEALGEGPYFAGAHFSLVDAVFGPVFRYFEVFDAIADSGLFAERPRLRAWRKALAARPSIRTAVTEGYEARLRAFLRERDAWLLRRRPAPATDRETVRETAREAAA